MSAVPIALHVSLSDPVSNFGLIWNMVRGAGGSKQIQAIRKTARSTVVGGMACIRVLKSSASFSLEIPIPLMLTEVSFCF